MFVRNINKFFLFWIYWIWEVIGICGRGILDKMEMKVKNLSERWDWKCRFESFYLIENRVFIMRVNEFSKGEKEVRKNFFLVGKREE